MRLINLFLAASLLCTTNVIHAQKYVGGDISMLKKFVDSGAIYKDKDGNSVEPYAFFREQGWNAVRLRLFVAPSKASADDKKEGAIQDLDYVTAMAKDVKAAGYRLMLDFHYSDTWTDPGQHSTPAAWKGNATELAEKVYEYTKESLKALKEAGVTPDFIQPGNEITYGMMWPTAHIWPAGGGQDGGTWSNFTSYLKSAIKACKEECPDAQIVIHTEMSKSENVTNFYKELAKYTDVEYDIIGLSYYPDYHNSLKVLETLLTQLEASYPSKKIMIVETGYGFEWQLSGSKYNFTGTYPTTEEGQKKFTTDLIALLNKHQNVNGLFWWYPEYTLNNIVFMNGSEDWSKDFTSGYWNAALFHYKSGKALSALYELKNFAPGSDTGIRDIDKRGDTNTESWYSLDGRKLNKRPDAKGIYIVNGKKVIVK